MFIINDENVGLIRKVSSVREVLRSDQAIKLDLPYSDVMDMYDAGLPAYKLLRAWVGCDERFVQQVGIDDLTYNELEAAVLNPSISKLALEHHRFEQVLPKPIFDEAMAGLTYSQCVEYRLDIVDTLKVPTISPRDKRRMIDDALKTNLLPVRSVDELEDVACSIFSLDLAKNLMDVEHSSILVDTKSITKEAIRSTRAYNGLMMLLASGIYSAPHIGKLMTLCDHYSKYDYIRNLPKIPNTKETKSWFDVCRASPATIKYVATNGIFTNNQLDEFIDIIELHGCMADMILLYENRRLLTKQARHVKASCTCAIDVVDYRPSLFDRYITDGTDLDIEEFVATYREFPSSMLLLQSSAALARTGIYYMYHVTYKLEFLIEYLIRTTDVELTDRELDKLLSIVVKSDDDEAILYFLLSDKIPVDFKEMLISHIY